MTDAGRRALLLVALAATAALAARAAWPAPSLGPPALATCCAIAVQFPDGVRCLDAAEAARLGARPGDAFDADGPAGRMAPARLEALAVPLDLNRAPVEELATLPDVGPAFARRIAAARPFRSVDDLRRIPGLGRARARAAAARLYVTE